MRTNCWSYADTRKHAVGRSRGKQSIRTLYLDWEWDQGEHRLRLEQMFGDMPRGLFYWRCDRPLAQLGDAIRRVVRRNRIEYLVVDSIAYACGHAPEAADTAANYKRAVDRLGIGSLHIAHVPKAGDKAKPFGSAFWHNSARSTWYVEEEATTKKGAITKVDLKWFHRKNNRGAKETHPRLVTFTVDSENNTIRFAARYISGKTPSTLARVQQVVAAAAKLRAEIRDLLPDVEADTLRKAIQRGLGEGALKEDASGLIGLPTAA